MESRIELLTMRAQGAGGQNVNKVETAVHLRFDVRASSLPEDFREKVLLLKDHRMTKDGVIIIKVIPFDASVGHARQLGFMAGEISVPEDFDHMGSNEIAAIFV